MTDKTIINGVDVSGCEFFFRDNINGIFTQELCACMEEHTGADSYKTQCIDNPNCYYKQSARKDERIRELEEKLSDAIKLAKQNADSNEYCLQELEKENGNLKQKLAAKNSLLNDSQKVIERLAIKLQSPLKVKPTDPTEPLYRKLSQIAELADLIVNDDDKPACVHDKDCPLNGGDGFDNHCNTTCPFIIAQQIKQIAQGE